MKLSCRIQRNHFLLPACAAAVLTMAGCIEFEEELLLPEGAYTPENKAVIPAANASPEAGIGVQNPAGSTSVGGTMTLEEDVDMQPVAPAPAAKDGKKTKPAPAAKKDEKKAAEETIYTVRKGDTLGSIAKQYKLNWRTLAEHNKLDAKARIYPGQKLRIPAVDDKKKDAADKNSAYKIHVVKKGEYAGKIAAMYKVKLADLLTLNDIKDGKKLKIGQKLRIPNTVAAPAAKKDDKKADKKPAAKKAEQKPAKKTDGVPVIKPEVKKEAAAPQSSAAKIKPNVTVAPAPVAEVSADIPTLDMKLDRDMTLEQVSQAFDRSVDVLKKHNPSLQSGEVLKAGTTVVVPIF
ncbi:MAG: LysM peptidoglycan-binding domain-containing protein [Lentisphaeria bacterium]|nr:LysM peptidoglycan-binding domain-containing protein [Lentisphaeria bacterium]